MGDDEYSCAAAGKLKLKNDSQMKKSKKKKKSKDKEKEIRKTIRQAMDGEGQYTESGVQVERTDNERQLTKAEKAFKQQQEKMRNKRIMERATTTHKERVEKFNEHLDTLTEHFDIPKVSWTK